MNARGLIVSAILLVALSGVVWWAKKHPDSGTTSSTSTTVKLIDLPADQLQQIELKKKGAKDLTLKRQSGKWQIVSPEAFAADQDAVSSLASSVSPLSADSVVEDKPTDLSKFGLAAPSLTVELTASGGKHETLLVGDEAPVGSIVYAKHGNDPKVYALNSSSKTSLDKSVNDLRDKRLLTFDSGKLTSLELDTKKGPVVFGKSNSGDWQIVKPAPYRADSFQVEDLIRKLQDAKMDFSASADDQKKSAASYATGTPAATVKATDASGTQTLEVRKNKTDYFAKTSVVPGLYKLSADAGAAVDKSLDDFRNKKLFDFGFSDATKLGYRNGTMETTYAKSGQDWKQDGKTLDASSVQAVIDQLRDLSATGFPASGFANPTIDLSVVSNDGKRTEKVVLAKVGDKYIAKRENEASLYELAAKPVDDLVKAFGQIKPAAPAKKK